MYFYDENKTLYENFKALLSDYNRVCAIVDNNETTATASAISNKSQIDYVAMMTDTPLPNSSQEDSEE